VLARAGPSFVARSRRDGAGDRWAVAERLATAGLIASLASQGIVVAILPEFGGSNIGVPGGPLAALLHGLRQKPR